MSDAQALMGTPGDIINWPMLKIHYRTDQSYCPFPPGITVVKELTSTSRSTTSRARCARVRCRHDGEC